MSLVKILVLSNVLDSATSLAAVLEAFRTVDRAEARADLARHEREDRDANDHDDDWGSVGRTLRAALWL